ncbi:hypothetical protein B0J11DRAFT_505929 [Dendryphion nanum]|uniref:Extracellular membrane protein CFEM domain-containing protein n=1 Tax=Dendryphion nanum TaxID=256645 RepID=A0A9P9DZE6_9PLEO|nr:hypothetical protein B0J11DRAFT_505929 [Dendryphion nanum]
MRFSLLPIAGLLSLAPQAFADGPTKIFINQVPEYSSMSKCAEPKVSTIVRNMVFGCGDGQLTTSFACFCYENYTKYATMIGSQVAAACTQDVSQSSLAIEVFSKYCDLGEATPTSGSLRASTTNATSASPSGSIASTTAPSTASSPTLISPTSTISSSSSSITPSPTLAPSASSTASPAPTEPVQSNNSTAVTAAAITVPISVVAIAGLGMFFWLRRRRAEDMSQEKAVELETNNRVFYEADTKSAAVVYTMENPINHLPVEIDGTMMRAELGHSRESLIYRVVKGRIGVLDTMTLKALI